MTKKLKEYVMGEKEKDCECGCEKVLIRRETESDFMWAKRSYSSVKCKRDMNNFNF